MEFPAVVKMLPHYLLKEKTTHIMLFTVKLKIVQSRVHWIKMESQRYNLPFG